MDEVARAGGREEGVKAGRQLAPGLLYIQDTKPKVNTLKSLLLGSSVVNLDL